MWIAPCLVAWGLLSPFLAVLIGSTIGARSNSEPVPEPPPIGSGPAREAKVRATRYAGCAVLEVIAGDGPTRVALLPSIIGYPDGRTRCGAQLDVVFLQPAGVGTERVVSLLAEAERSGERVDVCYETMSASSGVTDLRVVTVTVCGGPTRVARSIDTSPTTTRL